MSEPLYSFEAEHIFAQELWGRLGHKDFLEKHGYQQHMIGNLIGLFSDPDVVAQIQSLPDDHPWKAAILDADSGFGTV